jgi:hypothetical protein
MRLRGFAALLLLLLTPASAPAALFPCDEAGVLAAVAAGGGPHTFACGGPTTIVTSAEIVVPHAVELDGGGLLTLSGGNAHRVLRVEGVSAFTATLRNLTLTQGVASGATGGCVSASRNLTLVGVQVLGCEAAYGGGVGSMGALLTVTGCTVSGNLATGGEVGGMGGGISTTGSSFLVVTNSLIRDNTAQLGGGIATNAELEIAQTTIASNVAAVGGGILVTPGGLGNISRSTFSDNRATNVAGGGGGGLASQSLSLGVLDSTFARNVNAAITNAAVSDNPSLQIERSTFAENTGALPAIHQLAGARMHLRNNVIAGRCGGGLRSSLGGNVESPGATCVQGALFDQGNVSSAALNLGKLGEHGGPTKTIPVHAPSIAIGNANFCLASTTDQRGVARPQGPNCDSGAFEQDFAEPVPALPPIGVAVLALALAAGARYRRFGSSTP